MPLGGCDIVLGVQWLRTIGPVLWDFDKLYMKFRKENTTYCFSTPETLRDHVQDVSIFQMEKVLQQESSIGAFLFQIQLENVVQYKESLSYTQRQQLQQLLQDYEMIFLTPRCLPPHRSHDHMISLVEGNKPPSMGPYRYRDPYRKQKLRSVHELLDAGFIRVSNSLYSSLVILVKKKENTWRMCME